MEDNKKINKKDNAIVSTENKNALLSDLKSFKMFIRGSRAIYKRKGFAENKLRRGGYGSIQ